MSENEISEVTRRNIFDELRLGALSWNGRESESAFLCRLFDLASMRSHDHRCRNMLEDVRLHRENFSDGGDDWVFDDGRLNLLRCPDETLLSFLCETVHPIVRPDEPDVDALAKLYNHHLAADGYELTVKSFISGRRVFAGRRISASVSASTSEARKVAHSVGSEYLSTQVARMEASVLQDPQLAIGSAKEFVESVCKLILRERRVSLSGSEDLPKLAKLARDAVGLTASAEAEQALKSCLGAMATIVHTIAELRGRLGTGHGADPISLRPSPDIAALSVRMATAMALFLFERHKATPVPSND